MKKVALVSLGCAKNLVDSEMVLAMLKEGFEIITDPSKADVIIVNTCGFILDAKKESIDTIFKMRAYKQAKLVVIGCLVQRYYSDIVKEMPEVDLFVPIKEYRNLHLHLKELFKEEKINPLNPLKRVLGDEHFAYLRISEGCDHFCAFCAIPFIRGRYTSRPMDEILTEARLLLEAGIQEIALISQDPAAYGCDFPTKKPDFCDLLLELDKLGFSSIRMLYLYPFELTNRFIEVVKNSKSIEPYFDIPVQAGSNNVLKAMRRPDRVETNLALVKAIREAIPHAVFRTTLIAGFPGETKEDVEETLNFIKEARFDHVGVFSYSKEEGTLAASLKGQVKESEKKARRLAYLEMASKMSYENNKARVGEVMKGFVIGKAQDKYLLRSYYNAPDEIDGTIMFTPLKEHELGEIVKVKITKGYVHDLEGEEIN